MPQSRDTYATLKRVLEDSNAPYAHARPNSFLQGSYCNDTNVRGDSDVDVVLRQNLLFYYNLDALGEAEKAEFRRIHPGPAQYDLAAFKKDVIAGLSKSFGIDLDTSGSKALFVRGRADRRNADILVAAPHRRFIAYPNQQDQRFVEGVIFFTSNETSIINYPKQHFDNLTRKHQETNEWFKPAVRMFKNMRTRTVEEGLLGEGVAPSYFLEGTLHNVPPENFGRSLRETVERSCEWLADTNEAQFLCANGQHMLLRDGSPTSWAPERFRAFLKATGELWNQW